jgi:hypothetical protein
MFEIFTEQARNVVLEAQAETLERATSSSVASICSSGCSGRAAGWPRSPWPSGRSPSRRPGARSTG